jgi:hypothetical protein
MIATINQLVAEIDRMQDAFILTKNQFGEELCTIAAQGVDECTSAGCDSEGNSWPPLSYEYQQWKSTVAPGKPIGVLFMAMLQWKELIGRLTINTYAMVQRYGVSMIARIHAYKFQEGGAVTGGKQPPRPFWGFTASAIQRMDQCATSNFDKALP